MNKVINGRMYNTETAKEVASYSNGYNYNDFNYYSEELYKKKTGEFFLYGYGNANSKYAESNGNMRDSGSEIIPLDIGDVKKWVEEHADGDTYVELFGEVEE